ncbi:MAG: EAL domain-containing protein [Gammaproteobacteria bacterium]
MNDSVLIYSLSDRLSDINNSLAPSIKVIPIQTLISRIETSDRKPNAVIFEINQIDSVLDLIQHTNITSENRFICIGENLSVDNRIILLNNNIELVNSDKFSELSSSYFQLGLGKERQKVLFLDDDEDQIAITEHILKDAGFSVKSITKSEYILDTLADYKPDLLLLDLYLGDVTGDKIVSIIRKEPKYRFLPIVFLTADTTLESRMLVLNAGADDLITKPIKSDLLVASIKNRIQRNLNNQVFLNELNPNRVYHKVNVQESDLQKFYQENIDNPLASFMWFKVNNKTEIQREIGYSGFSKLCNTVCSKTPNTNPAVDFFSKIADGVYVIGFNTLDEASAIKTAEDIKSWYEDNSYTVVDRNYSFQMSVIVLTNIPQAKDHDTLLQKAESILIESNETQSEILKLQKGIEETRFYTIKSRLENMIKTRDLAWQFYPIVSARHEEEEIFQLILNIDTDSSIQRFKTIEYINVAEKSGLLRVIDRFALERAIRVIRSGIHENSPPKVLLNQVTLAYTDRESRAKKLEIIKQLNLPKDSLYVQFHLQDVVDTFEHIGEIGQQIKQTGIKICLGSFDYSSIAWKAARKLNVSWIRLLPPSLEDKHLFDAENPNNIASTIRKAHVLGYEVIAHMVDNSSLASELLKANIDYLQGSYIKTPVAISDIFNK